MILIAYLIEENIEVIVSNVVIVTPILASTILGGIRYASHVTIIKNTLGR